MFRKQWWLTAALLVIAAVAGGLASNGFSFLAQEAQAQRNTTAAKLRFAGGNTRSMSHLGRKTWLIKLISSAMRDGS